MERTPELYAVLAAILQAGDRASEGGVVVITGGGDPDHMHYAHAAADLVDAVEAVAELDAEDREQPEEETPADASHA
jgi:hypothetical protein